MAVQRSSYQLAHIMIVIAYTLFCVSVLGIAHPIYRLLAAIGTALPVLWAVWIVAHALIPPETLDERLKEEIHHSTAGPRYRHMTREVVALSRSAKDLDHVSSAVASGQVSREAAFHRVRQIQLQMQRRVEKIADLAL